MNHTAPTTGALLRPSPIHDGGIRDPGAVGSTNRHDDGNGSAPGYPSNILMHNDEKTVAMSAPRRVPAPGATQAAIARLAAAKCQPQATVGTKRNASSSMLNGTAPVPSGKKVPAPGATQAAIARLATLKSASASGAPKISEPLVVLQVMSTGGQRRVPAPGATQAAMARLAALKESGKLPPTGPQLPASAPTLFKTSQPLASGDFMPGAVLWAKMQSYPWWPAQVQQPTAEQNRLRHNAGDVFVVFYGTADYTWIPISDLRPFRTTEADYAKFAAAKNTGLQRAIDDAWHSLGQHRPDKMGKMMPINVAI